MTLVEDLSCDINIHLCHGQYLLWEAKDVDSLRTQFGIVGCLIGCYSRIPKQNCQLGLPLQLSKVQAKFVIENCNANVVDCAVSINSLNCHQMSLKEVNYREQQLGFQKLVKKEQKVEQLEDKADDIRTGKLKKLKKQANYKSESSTNNGDEPEIHSKVEEICSDDYFKRFTDSELQKVDQTDQVYINMPVKRSCTETRKVMNHLVELSDEELIEYHVLVDLINRGYIVTDGRKFGGHFLVYPGDPGLYHSTYIAHCSRYDQDISAVQFATLGRLALSVKKTLLLCSVDDSNCVVYNSVAWSGIV